MKLFLVRYINAGVELYSFTSMRQAVKWVYESERMTQPLSNNLRKLIRRRIKNSIEDKRKYCKGKWIICDNI